MTTEPPPTCWNCGRVMSSLSIPGAFACRCAAILDNGKRLFCDCGFCQDRSWQYRLHAALNETGLAARGAVFPVVFLLGEPGYGEGI